MNKGNTFPSMISVIIATRNRASSLARTLDSLESLQSRLPWEVIVVDNGSTDGTSDVIETSKARGRVTIRHAVETQPGKPIALNTGLHLAQGDVIVFTDDDCVVASNWLDAIQHAFETDSELDALGGRVEPHSEDDARVAVRTGKDRVAFTSPSQLFNLMIGCNLAFKRTVFDHIGGYDPLVGPGAPLRSGNDVDIIYRAYRVGFRLAYVPEVLVYHAHGRRSTEDVEAVQRRYQTGRGAFYAKYILKGHMEILGLAVREITKLVRAGLVHLVHGRSPRTQLRNLGRLGLGFAKRLQATFGPTPRVSQPIPERSSD